MEVCACTCMSISLLKDGQHILYTHTCISIFEGQQCTYGWLDHSCRLLLTTLHTTSHGFTNYSNGWQYTTSGHSCHNLNMIGQFNLTNQMPAKSHMSNALSKLNCYKFIVINRKSVLWQTKLAIQVVILKTASSASKVTKVSQNKWPTCTYTCIHVAAIAVATLASCIRRFEVYIGSHITGKHSQCTVHVCSSASR